MCVDVWFVWIGLIKCCGVQCVVVFVFVDVLFGVLLCCCIELYMLVSSSMSVVILSVCGICWLYMNVYSIVNMVLNMINWFDSVSGSCFDVVFYSLLLSYDVLIVSMRFSSQNNCQCDVGMVVCIVLVGIVRIVSQQSLLIKFVMIFYSIDYLLLLK